MTSRNLVTHLASGTTLVGNGAPDLSLNAASRYTMIASDNDYEYQQNCNESSVHDSIISFEGSRGPVWGKFGGPCACGGTFSYFFPLPKALSKPFVFKNVVAKEGLSKEAPAGLGAAGPSGLKLGPPISLPSEKLQHEEGALYNGNHPRSLRTAFFQPTTQPTACNVLCDFESLTRRLAVPAVLSAPR